MAKAGKDTKTIARGGKRTGGGIRWRLWGGLAGAGVLCVSTAVAARRVHQYVTADPQFTLSRENPAALRCEGLRYTASAKVERVFAGDFERSIFAMPLAERRRRLLAIDWVEDASVSRVWPDRLLVRIRERRPVAFVNLRSGPLLIDAQGVLLEPPAGTRFPLPVLSGVSEEVPETRRAGQVRAMLGLLGALADKGRDVSEVNASDPANLRLIAQIGGRAVELHMGDRNYSPRYANFLNHYPEIHRRSPAVKIFDLRLDDRILAKE